MKSRSSQSGFSAFELIVILAIAAVLALIGYKVYSRSPSYNSSNQSYSQQPAAIPSTAPAINSSSDLDKAQTTLDQNDPSTSNTSDSSQLDSQLNGF